ncbi:hypothetical protein PG993_008006 [Apiospora rasikravindrae]|uniref:Uncharacterized protein n=1 Tax=Apiospora rasikravindrae TaxID=990691 RepID=A0ABR1SZ43_9PEZI
MFIPPSEIVLHITIGRHQEAVMEQERQVSGCLGQVPAHFCASIPVKDQSSTQKTFSISRQQPYSVIEPSSSERNRKVIKLPKSSPKMRMDDFTQSTIPLMERALLSNRTFHLEKPPWVRTFSHSSVWPNRAGRLSSTLASTASTDWNSLEHFKRSSRRLTSAS